MKTLQCLKALRHEKKIGLVLEKEANIWVTVLACPVRMAYYSFHKWSVWWTEIYTTEKSFFDHTRGETALNPFYRD